MPATVDEFNGVELSDIDEVNGISKGSIDEWNAHCEFGTEVSSKWLVGANNGKLFSTTTADASSNWAQLVDLGGNSYKDLAIGKDSSGNKRWVVFASNNTNEIAFINDSADMTNASNWTEVDLSPNHKSVEQGVSMAYGNEVWILGGTTGAFSRGGTTYYDGPHRSTDGGANWTKIDVNNTGNEGMKTMNYKEGNIWLVTFGPDIWKSTDNGLNWTLLGTIEAGKDIMCLAYDGNNRWVAGLDSDNVYYSDDDGSNWTEVATGVFAGNWKPYGVVYAGGSINKWIMVGQSGRMSYSSDGASWSTNWAGDGLGENWATNTIYGIATDHYTVVIVGANGKIATSTDGINFALRAITGNPTDTLWNVSSNVIGAGMR